MQAILHVPVSLHFNLRDIHRAVESILDPTFNSRSEQRLSQLKNGSSTGEKWTWVTSTGNAIRVWQTTNTDHQTIIAIELSSRRHALNDKHNGVGRYLLELEKQSGINRRDWKLIMLESMSDDPWWKCGVYMSDDWACSQFAERTKVNNLYLPHKEDES